MGGGRRQKNETDWVKGRTDRELKEGLQNWGVTTEVLRITHNHELTVTTEVLCITHNHELTVTTEVLCITHNHELTVTTEVF